MAENIKVNTPLVELDGDEMTRIIWQMITAFMLMVIFSVYAKSFPILKSILS